MSKKKRYVLVAVLSLVMITSSVIGGSLAWIIANTDPVVNTFTYGDIDLKLDETELDEEGTPVDKDNDGNPDKTTEGNDYQIVPGEEYLKDPTVTVLAGNEACWLFVKLTETEKFDEYLTYEVSEGWTQLEADGTAVEGVYFRYVAEDSDDTEVAYPVLKDNKIVVLETVTKEMLNALDNNGEDAATAEYPSLSVVAYAVQYSGFEALDDSAEEMNNAALKAWKAVEAK